MQSVITKMREDNEHLVKSLMKAYEDRQALNSRILVLQQVTLENEHKESEAIQHLNNNIQSLKQLIDRQQVIID
jgi:translation initiation factor 2 beta subunit (eIF-2beta)/eIF-5